MISWVKKKAKRYETRLNTLAGALVDVCMGNIWDMRVQGRGQFSPGEIRRLHHGRGPGKCSVMPTEWSGIFTPATRRIRRSKWDWFGFVIPCLVFSASAFTSQLDTLMSSMDRLRSTMWSFSAFLFPELWQPKVRQATGLTTLFQVKF